jgi:hypothetical protein
MTFKLMSKQNDFSSFKIKSFKEYCCISISFFVRHLIRIIFVNKKQKTNMNLDSKCIEEWSVQATRFFLDKGIYSRELVFSQLVKALGINIFNFFSKDWILNAADQQILEIADQLNVTDAEEFKALLKGDVAHCENWSNDFIVDWIMVRGFAVKLDLKKVITRAGNLEHNLSRYLDSFFGVPVSTVEIQELMKGLGILESKQFSSGKIEIHDAAWNQEYRENNARKRLLLHLCAQEERLKSISCHWPCVAVIQSSGYGKSRLVKEMLKKENWRMNDPVKRNVIYWNFGKPEHNGYPRGNRLDLPSLSLCRNDVIEEFKIQMLEEIGVIDDGATGIWFIVDEVSKLLKIFSSDGISFYRCLRAAGYSISRIIRIKILFIAIDTLSNVVYCSSSAS